MQALSPTLYFVAAVLGAYLIGSLSFAVIISRVMGLSDPRSYGSKNPGATNVLRSDAVKGWLPMALLQWKGREFGLGDGALAAVGLAAFLGHLYPVFFAFKGGKGVATAAGALFGVHWLLGLAGLGTWLLVAYLSRYSSLSALITAIAAPLYYLLGDRELWYADKSVLLLLVVMGALLVYRHRENIGKLLQGKESKIGAKSKN